MLSYEQEPRTSAFESWFLGTSGVRGAVSNSVLNVHKILTFHYTRGVPKFKALSLVVLALFSLLFHFSNATAQAKIDPACSLEKQGDFERRICQNATIHELDRKLGRLEEELQNGWHLGGEASFEQGEKWRAAIQAKCHDDACLEQAFRVRLALLNGFPTFSCSSKLTRLEALICHTPNLGLLDRTLNYEFGVALDLSFATLELRSAQTLWLQNIRNACQSSGCLTRVYTERIAFLKRSQAKSQARYKRESKVNVGDARDMGVKLKIQISKTQEQRIFKRYKMEICEAHPDPVDWLDLNRDGHPDPVFMSCFGAHNESVYFFLWEKNHYRLVLEGTVGYFGYSLQDTRIHGFPVLRLITHGSCCDHPSAYFAFNGREYTQVALYDEHYIRDDFFTFLPALN